MKPILIIPAIIFALCSCKTKEIATHTDYRTDYIRTLTPYILPVETANATALLECTREGAILLSQLNIETTRNAYLNLRLDSINQLTIEAIVQRDTLYIPTDSIVITRDVLRTAIEYRDRPLSRWQQLKQEAGGIAIGACIALLLAAIAYLLFKLKK